jgi:hypothetical protein
VGRDPFRYYLARLREAGVERPVSFRLPRRYISASTCLCEFFTDSWVWDNARPMDGAGNFVKGIRGFEERLTRAARFGITVERLPDVIRWSQLRCGRDFGFPSGYYRLADARRAADWISLPPEAYPNQGVHASGLGQREEAGVCSGRIIKSHRFGCETRQAPCESLPLISAVK